MFALLSSAVVQGPGVREGLPVGDVEGDHAVEVVLAEDAGLHGAEPGDRARAGAASTVRRPVNHATTPSASTCRRGSGSTGGSRCAEVTFILAPHLRWSPSRRSVGPELRLLLVSEHDALVEDVEADLPRGWQRGSASRSWSSMRLWHPSAERTARYAPTADGGNSRGMSSSAQREA